MAAAAQALAGRGAQTPEPASTEPPAEWTRASGAAPAETERAGSAGLATDQTRDGRGRGSATDAFTRGAAAQRGARVGDAAPEPARADPGPFGPDRGRGGEERRTPERRFASGQWHETVSASYPVSLGRSARAVPPRAAPMVPVVPVVAEPSGGPEPLSPAAGPYHAGQALDALAEERARQREREASDYETHGYERQGHEAAAERQQDPAWNAVSGTFALPESAPQAEDDFEPANATEAELYDAARQGSTDVYLSTLLLATVLVPMTSDGLAGAGAGVPRTEVIEGQRYLVVFTSQQRLGEHFGAPVRTRGVRFVDLIQNWPDPEWSFAVNPGGPVGATLPSSQLAALASWAAESGLGIDEAERAPEAPKAITPAAPTAVPTMQKIVPAQHVDYLLDRGYDRVSGFVYRAHELAHLRTPAELAAALGLGADVKELHVLRWPAHRPNLYRIPYGGPTEAAMRAMDGWVIERAPFRGNGFAPADSADVVAEFKVDSVRLPHGAQLWHLDAGGAERLVALFDADAAAWRRVGEG